MGVLTHNSFSSREDVQWKHFTCIQPVLMSFANNRINSIKFPEVYTVSGKGGRQYCGRNFDNFS